MRGFTAGIIGGAVGHATGDFSLGFAATAFCLVVFLALKDIEKAIRERN